MHIAFFSDQNPATLGGLQVSLGLQREFLELAGHTVTVCAPTSRRAPTRRYMRDSDVLLRSTPVGDHSFNLAGPIADRATDAGFARRPPVDLVHVQADVWGAWNGYRFARRHALPVVHTMHTNVEVGLPAIMPFPRAVFRLLFAAQQRHMRTDHIRDIAGYTRAFADSADALIAPSTHFVERLRGYGISQPISVVPTGIDDRVARLLRAESELPRDRPLLVWPGRISQEKRLDELIEAFALADVDAEIHVYGSGPERGRCAALAARRGLESRVRFFGAVAHGTVLRAMRHADAVVQTSLDYETQGLTVYESVGLGTPVIVRDPKIAHDLPPSARHDVADGSVGALADAISSFVRAWPAAATPPADAVEAFAQSRLTERILGIYRATIARSRPTSYAA
ncbi:MAG: hypothetical protein K0S37_2177 [Microbacterium sp.]|jgi:glycosyltransferase involved in cell wall biosynthesis|nr:hypothetical protein [Microbacterium sp.]